MIDWNRIQILRDDIGNDDFPDVVEIFIEEVSEMMDALQGAAQVDMLGDHLHALKGSALNLGFTAFADLCQAGETAASNGRADEIDIAPIIDCYEASKELFLNGLETNKAA